MSYTRHSTITYCFSIEFRIAPAIEIRARLSRMCKKCRRRGKGEQSYMHGNGRQIENLFRPFEICNFSRQNKADALIPTSVKQEVNASVLILLAGGVARLCGSPILQGHPDIQFRADPVDLADEVISNIAAPLVESHDQRIRRKRQPERPAPRQQVPHPRPALSVAEQPAQRSPLLQSPGLYPFSTHSFTLSALSAVIRNLFPAHCLKLFR